MIFPLQTLKVVFLHMITIQCCYKDWRAEQGARAGGVPALQGSGAGQGEGGLGHAEEHLRSQRRGRQNQSVHNFDCIHYIFFVLFLLFKSYMIDCPFELFYKKNRL